jgi:hypothetical protein
MSTHAPAQAVSVDAQLAPHALCEQTWFVAHAVAQVPQWAGSVVVSTQTPPQSVCPPVQAQAPALHVCPPVQTFPQLPQLLGSFLVFTHAPPHCTC